MSKAGVVLFPLLLASLVGCAAAPEQPFDLTQPKRSAKGADGKATDDAPGGGEKETQSAPEGPVTGAARRSGVVFVHGTGDQGNVPDYACSGAGDDFHCEVKIAVDEYWLRPTIDSEIKRPDGTHRPFAVLGCPLGSQTPWPNATPVKGTGPEPGSAACAGTEIARFLDGEDGKTGTADDITDVVIVTHSGGSNVARYMLQQHSSKPEFDRLHKASRGFIGIAAPSHGTYLADWVFRNGSLANTVNNVIGFFGGEGLYNDDGTNFIRTSAMSQFNRDPAKLVDLAKDVAGVPSFMAGGTYPMTSGDDAKVDCGGGAETKGLGLLHSLYLNHDDAPTFRDDCSDGFISCKSAMALTNGDIGRVIFGRLDDGRTVGKTLYRAHNQSRRQCDDLDLDIRKAVNAILTESGKSPAFAGGGIGALRTRYFEADSSFDGVVEPSLAGAHIVAQRVLADDDDVVLEVDVDVSITANLGIRATLVATDAGSTSFVIGSAQTAAQSRPGRKTFTLRFPRSAAGTGERLTVRDLALVDHDRASTLAMVPMAGTAIGN